MQVLGYELPVPALAGGRLVETPEEIVSKSLQIAGDLCIYTNQNHVIEVLEA